MPLDDVLDDESVTDLLETEDESESESESEPEPEPEAEEEVEEEEELKEPEEELEEEEPDDELVLPIRRGEILKKYPQFFKEFPYMEKALYKTQQYEEIFSDPDSAKQASESLQEFKQLESELTESGKLTPILKAIKQADENAFYKLADNYLDSLREVDRNTHLHVAGNIISQTIAGMIQEGNRINNDPLKQAAQILSQFAFGTSEFQPPSKLSHDDPNIKDKEEIARQREEFNRQRLETTQKDLDGRVRNKINAIIKTNIDPKQSMTDYVRRTASRDVFESLTDQLSDDSQFKSMMDRLWEKAFESNFSKQATDKIFYAYNTKAKTILPQLIKKARAEALKGLGKRANTNESSSRHLPASEQTASVSKTVKGKDISRMSTLDIFNME